jgi:hypothetical protein
VTTRNTSSYLPNLTGPLDLEVDGVSVDIPRRGTINLVGFTIEDDPDNERTDITSEAGSSDFEYSELRIGNPAGTFWYTLTGAAIVADRALTLPLLTGPDTLVVLALAQTLTNKTINGASNTLTVRLANDVSGTLPVANGGTGITALGAGVATFLGTPSGANLASALTTALPDSKGGTGITALGTGVATFLGTPSGANLASALTTALPDSKGGTGLTALGTGVATFLGTPSGANLASALTTPLPTSKGGTGNAGVAANIFALDISWTLTSVHTKTLAAGANTFTFSNQGSGLCIIVRLTSDGGGSTVTWPTVLWPGGVAPTQTATGVDVYTFVHDGTDIYGSVVQDMS